MDLGGLFVCGFILILSICCSICRPYYQKDIMGPVGILFIPSPESCILRSIDSAVAELKQHTATDFYSISSHPIGDAERNFSCPSRILTFRYWHAKANPKSKATYNNMMYNKIKRNTIENRCVLSFRLCLFFSSGFQHEKSLLGQISLICFVIDWMYSKSIHAGSPRWDNLHSWPVDSRQAGRPQMGWLVLLGTKAFPS